MQSENGDLTDKCVLVVEDEYLLAEDLRRALAQSGVAVVGPFASVAQAFCAIDAHAKLDFALLDIRLRDNQLVYPVAEKLIQRQIPFAFTTGYESSTVFNKYRDVAHFEKPYDCRTIVKFLRRRL